MIPRFIPALLATFTVAAGPALAAEKPVYRVDSVIAMEQGGFIAITAKGAVQSGGWKGAKLRVIRGDAHTLVVNFVAEPPSGDAAVMSLLLPINATAKLKARKGVVAVRAVAAANDVTIQILH